MILIPDEGIPTAKLVIIGEAPAKYEEQQRRPLVGPSGFKLMEWLGGVGLTRSDAYLTNVLPFRAPGDKIEAVDKATIAQWVEALHGRLAALRAAVVLVPLGNTALRALTGKFGITKYRGSVLEYIARDGRRIKVIPTIHPAALLHRGGREDEAVAAKQARTWERACRADWRRIADDLAFPELRLPQYTIHTRPTLHDLQWFVQQAYRPDVVLTLDIETPREITFVPQPPTKKGTPRKAKKVVGARRVACIGLGVQPNEALVVPTTLKYWGSAEQLALAWTLLRLALHGPAQKCTHNGFFDYYYLGDHGVQPRQWQWDTLAMHHALDPADDHSLAYCASKDTRQPYWKGMHKDAKDGDDDEAGVDEIKDLDTYWRYCGYDVCVTRALKDVYQARLVAADHLGYYQAHYGDLLEPLLELSRHGLQADRAAMEAEQTRLKVEQVEVREKLANLAGASLHGKKALSSKKVLEFLYTTLRLPVQYAGKGPRKRPSANEVAVRRLMLNKGTAARAAQVGGLILQDRRLQKLLEFTDPSRLDPDDRFRSTYKFTTDTGRLASEENPKGGGANAQNIDRQVRRVFVPDKWR